MKQIAEGAARLLAPDDGPRIAALAFDGWDTHANEGGATGRLATAAGAASTARSPPSRRAWARPGRTPSILVVTEFGRTARINGTVGTDHGTGTVAFLVGGAVKGGRVIADWPGLAPTELFEGRDLQADHRPARRRRRACWPTSSVSRRRFSADRSSPTAPVSPRSRACWPEPTAARRTRAAYHRTKRRKAAAPIAPTRSVASPYQMATNSGLSPVQFKA